MGGQGPGHYAKPIGRLRTLSPHLELSDNTAVVDNSTTVRCERTQSPKDYNMAIHTLGVCSVIQQALGPQQVDFAAEATLAVI